MLKTISTNNDTTYKLPNTATTARAIAAGILIQTGINSINNKVVCAPLMQAIKNENKPANVALIRKAINDAFSTTGLEKDGVKIIDAKESKSYIKSFLTDFFIFKKTPKQYIESINNLIDNLPENSKNINNALEKGIKLPMPKLVKTLFANSFRETLETGNNATYISAAKTIIANVEKMGSSVFHEMGHAINHNKSLFWKSLQKMRLPLTIIASTSSLTAILKRKKIKDEEPKNIFDQFTTFIKNNVGKIVGLSFVPIIAEELKATSRGNKLAKQVLKPELYKHVVKTNRLSAISYISTAVVTTATAILGSKIRDKIAKPQIINKDL